MDGCRSASALEEAARTHKERTGRPFVLIIDAVDRLAEHAPDILETLQERHCSLCHVLRGPSIVPVLMANYDRPVVWSRNNSNTQHN